MFFFLYLSIYIVLFCFISYSATIFDGDFHCKFTADFHSEKLEDGLWRPSVDVDDSDFVTQTACCDLGL